MRHLDFGGAAGPGRVSHKASDVGLFSWEPWSVVLWCRWAVVSSFGVSHSISCLRDPLGSEVQQDLGDPLAPQGAQGRKVPLEQQERKVFR